MFVSNDSEGQADSQKSSAIVRSAKTPAAIPGEVLPADALMLQADGPEPGAASRAVSLSSILRFKWTILAVFLLVAAPAIAMIWGARFRHSS